MDEYRLARGLGWFSVGLGLTQLVAPKWLGRKVGLGERTALMRALGARELVTGMGVLSQNRPAAPMWGRVLGDLMDMTLLGAALSSAASPSQRRDRLAGAAGMVAGVTLLDYVCARRLQQA